MKPPAWLVALHADVGAMLGAPLAEVSGRRTTDAASRAACLSRVAATPGLDADARLAFYQEQAWMRRLHAAQEAWPRLTRALGPWAFNEVAHDALRAHPPRGHDLGEAVAVVGPFLLARLPAADDACSALVRDAARFDAAERRALGAAWEPGVLTRSQVAPDLRLVASDGFDLVRERHDVATWPQRSEDGPAPALDTPRWWVVARAAHGVALRLVDPVHARLLAALPGRSLDVALERAARGLGPRETAHLDAHLGDWLVEAVREGWLRPRRA